MIREARPATIDDPAVIDVEQRRPLFASCVREVMPVSTYPQRADSVDYPQEVSHHSTLSKYSVSLSQLYGIFLLCLTNNWRCAEKPPEMEAPPVARRVFSGRHARAAAWGRVRRRGACQEKRRARRCGRSLRGKRRATDGEETHASRCRTRGGDGRRHHALEAFRCSQPAWKSRRKCPSA